jgi:hypothetical protein
MKPFQTLLLSTIAMLCLSTVQGQGLLKKIKNAANNAANSAVNGAANNAANSVINPSGNNQSNPPQQNNGAAPGQNNNAGRNNPSNKGGQGLVTTPPNVNENLGAAETAFKNGSYSEARYSVQQAMLGVEMEIGQKILKSLPETVASLKKDDKADQVTSTGWGWVGLTILREYEEGEKQFRVTIANNSAWMQAINLYFNSGYAQTTGGEQKWKQTKVKGYKAVIEYDENTGYKLSVPLGQTSLIVYEGVNFATEQEMMNAASQIDIDGIKKQLGEN